MHLTFIWPHPTLATSSRAENLSIWVKGPYYIGNSWPYFSKFKLKMYHTLRAVKCLLRPREGSNRIYAWSNTMTLSWPQLTLLRSRCDNLFMPEIAESPEKISLFLRSKWPPRVTGVKCYHFFSCEYMKWCFIFDLRLKKSHCDNLFLPQMAKIPVFWWILSSVTDFWHFEDSVTVGKW